MQRKSDRLILIGSSTGGVEALLNIIGHFPEDVPPCLIVQHTGNHFAKSLVRLLNDATRAQVKTAYDGEPIQNGCIYLAPNNKVHLTLDTRRTLNIKLLDEQPMTGHRPSIDRLFQSAVPEARQVIAAILTGMGKDGAKGILELRKAGAMTIGQDEATSVVYGMPRVANELGGIMRQLPINRIGPAIMHLAKAKAVK